MPRLSPSLLLKARHISPLLPLVLRETRTLDPAINELRWLKEHVSTTKAGSWTKIQRKELLGLCLRRSRSEPLQYILGSQPFGELDIKCRKEVLIPRPETEAYTMHVAKLLLGNKVGDFEQSSENTRKSKQSAPLRIVDVCSGSGCISLLLHSLLSPKFKDISVLGVDISPSAVALAKENLLHNIKQGNLSDKATSQVQFEIRNVLTQYPNEVEGCDIIISNPPYISRKKFITETSRSARIYEPTLALVPEAISSESDLADYQPEDVFYKRLLVFHAFFSSKMLVLEIGDEEQARRVVQMAIGMELLDANRVEVWRDWPDGEPEATEERVMRTDLHMDRTTEIPIKGTGMIRTIVLFRRRQSLLRT